LLQSNNIVDTYIGYYLNGEYNMEIIELLYESNVYQYTVNWLDCSVTPVENGFDLVWSVIDENGITVYQAFETVHLDQQ